GGDINRHRLAGATTACLRHCRRHAAVADMQPACDPDLCAPGDTSRAKDGGDTPQPRRRTRTGAIDLADQVIGLGKCTRSPMRPTSLPMKGQKSKINAKGVS